MSNNPNEQLPQAIEDYYERSTLNQQYEICLEFLKDRELFDDFEVWRDEKGHHEYLVDVKEFVEAHNGFDDWLVDCRIFDSGLDTVDEMER